MIDNEECKDSATDSPAVESPHGIRARLALWLVLGLVVFHAAMVALWIAPATIVRDTIGYDKVRGYNYPFFEQSWSVFAPTPDYGYNLWEIRATVKTAEGLESQTPWVPVSDREIKAGVRYHPFPSRTTAVTDRFATDQIKAFGRLNREQVAVINKADASVSLDEMRNRMVSAGTNPATRAAARTFVDIEGATEHFFSGIADAIWGDELVSYQLRRYARRVYTYTAKSQKGQYNTRVSFATNWRPVTPLTAPERSAFFGYVREQGIG